MPTCFQTYSPTENHSPLTDCGRFKSSARRFCCGYLPYSFQNLTKLRKMLENEYSPSGVVTPSRKAFSFVNGWASVVQPSELTTLTGLLSGIHSPQPPNKSIEKNSTYSIQCGGCHRIKLYGLIYGCEEQENIEIESVTPSPLHIACLLPNSASLISCMASCGAPINLTNQLGQTPLHALILGAVENDNIDEALVCLLSKGASLSIGDNAGDTPLLYVRNLLREELFSRAVHIAHRLLHAGANAQQINFDSRTLLTYSLQYLDDSFELTKILFNNGCSVWGADSLGETSAFTWLLDTLMLKRRMVNCERTLSLIGELMQSQPKRMKHLVGRVMISHSKCYQVYGGLFAEIKAAMEIYWKSPMSLLQLSRSAIRSAHHPNLQHFVTNANIPLPVKSYILYDSWPQK